MGYEINWSATPRIKDHPLYQKYSVLSYNSITANDVKNDIKAALANAESAAIVNYLAGVLRIAALVA